MIKVYSLYSMTLLKKTYWCLLWVPYRLYKEKQRLGVRKFRMYTNNF